MNYCVTNWLVLLTRAFSQDFFLSPLKRSFYYYNIQYIINGVWLTFDFFIIKWTWKGLSQGYKSVYKKCALFPTIPCSGQWFKHKHNDIDSHITDFCLLTDYTLFLLVSCIRFQRKLKNRGGEAVFLQKIFTVVLPLYVHFIFFFPRKKKWKLNVDLARQSFKEMRQNRTNRVSPSPSWLYYRSFMSHSENGGEKCWRKRLISMFFFFSFNVIILAYTTWQFSMLVTMNEHLHVQVLWLIPPQWNKCLCLVRFGLGVCKLLHSTA